MFSVVISLYIDAIFFLNFWPVYTFGVHWVAECGGGNQAKQFYAGTGTTGETNPVKPVSEES